MGEMDMMVHHLYLTELKASLRSHTHQQSPWSWQPCAWWLSLRPKQASGKHPVMMVDRRFREFRVFREDLETALGKQGPILSKS
jgi:hypothetical protein